MEQESPARIVERLDRIEAQLESLRQRVGAMEQSASAMRQAAAPQASIAAAPPNPSPQPVVAMPAAAPSTTAPPPIPSPNPPRPALGEAGRQYTASLTTPALPAVSVGSPAVSVGSPAVSESPEPWREFLRQFNLLPPTGENGNMEIQVGTWWASRIGTFFLVIAIVFGGVYIAQFSKPWVRFVELLTASFGLTLLGLWMERKYEKYGSVLFGGGLAAIFFCSFAAYSLPAVKILETPAAGAFWQFLAAGAIIGCALWRRSPIIATMGVFFGYVACFFSFHAGLNNFALTAALLLAGVASCFYQARRWTIAYSLSIPLTYLLYLAIFLKSWLQQGNVPGYWVCHGYLLACLGLFAGVDIAGLLHGRLLDQENRKTLQLLSSSAAVFLGFCVTHTFFRDQLSEYYFTYGIILTALAVYYYLAEHPDALMQGYFLKGSALVTMGLINSLGGRTRWVALGVESFILLVSARRTRLKVTEIMMGVAWLISLGFFIDAFLARTNPALRGDGFFGFPLLSWGGAMGLFYLMLSALLLITRERWLTPPEDTVQAPEFSLKWVFNVASIVGLNIALLVFSLAQAPRHDEPLTLCLMVAAMMAVGLQARHWIPFAAAALPFLLAHFMFWMASSEPSAVWINGGAVVTLTVALAALLDRHLARAGLTRQSGIQDASPWFVLLGMAHLIWMFSLQILFGKLFTDSAFLFLAAAATVATAAVSLRYPITLLRDLAPTVLALAVLRLLAKVFMAYSVRPLDLAIEPPYTVGGSEFFLWAALLLAWGYACAFVRDDLRRGLRLLQEQNLYQWLHGAVALLVGLFVLGQAPSLHSDWAVPRQMAAVLSLVPADEASMVAFALAALAIMALARWPGFMPGLYLGMPFLLLANLIFYFLAGRHGAEMTFLALGIGLAILNLAVALLARRLRPDLPREVNRQFQWLWGTLALALCLWLFLIQKGDLAHYTTAFWGISAIGVFLAGLLGRAKPLRLVGLAGMVLCIPRVFLIDIHSPLYRIAATAVLGTVVLLVAFLYYKYRDLIQAWDEKDEERLQA